MSKLAKKEKRAETSFEVRPLFRAYDRRELGLPSRALSRFGSIRLVDASTRASGVPRGSTQTISHKSRDIRCLSDDRRGIAMAAAVNILCSPRRTLNLSRTGISPRGPHVGATPENIFRVIALRRLECSFACLDSPFTTSRTPKPHTRGSRPSRVDLQL